MNYRRNKDKSTNEEKGDAPNSLPHKELIRDTHKGWAILIFLSLLKCISLLYKELYHFNGTNLQGNFVTD